MNWQDEGFLLSKIKFRENANIINVFTNMHGKVSGIVYGGNSRKIRNFLQISNKILPLLVRIRLCIEAPSDRFVTSLEEIPFKNLI